MEAPADIKKLFDEYSDNGVMNTDELRRFLVEIQGEQNATVEDAQGIMDGLKHLRLFQRRGLDLQTFFRYLLGDANPPLDPKLGVIFSISAGLTFCFIAKNSSFHLYLWP